MEVSNETSDNHTCNTTDFQLVVVADPNLRFKPNSDDFTDFDTIVVVWDIQHARH